MILEYVFFGVAIIIRCCAFRLVVVAVDVVVFVAANNVVVDVALAVRFYVVCVVADITAVLPDVSGFLYEVVFSFFLIVLELFSMLLAFFLLLVVVFLLLLPTFLLMLLTDLCKVLLLF